MSKPKTARTYNQNHVPRKYTPEHRRVSMYVAWSYPAEAGRNPYELDNRFSTMTEVRRVAWPDYEAPAWSDARQFQQGIAGSLEMFFWACAPFQEFIGEATGHAVPVFQRVDVLTEARQHGASDYFVRLGEPPHNNTTDESAYVVLPATMTFKAHARQTTQTGAIFTVALRKLAEGWRITAWAWTKGTGDQREDR
jgi:hypothetical protein